MIAGRRADPRGSRPLGLARRSWGEPDELSLRAGLCATCGGRPTGGRILVRRRADGEPLRVLCRPDRGWSCFRRGTGSAAVEAIELEVTS